MKPNLKDLKDLVEKWNMVSTKYYMNQAEWDDILKWGDRMSEENIKEDMSIIASNSIEVKKYLVARVKDGKSLDILRKVVREHFPQHLETLDKLLILK